MSAALRALPEHTWAAMAVALAGFLLLFVALQAVARLTAVRPEVTRKLFHTGSGVLTLAFPFLFHETWPVLVLTGASATVMAAVKLLPRLRTALGGVVHRVERTSLGEVYFPVAVALVFWLAHRQDPLLFVIPVLMLTFADATCALVGGRYGLTRYVGASKSLEGSVAFVVVAFFCVHVPLLAWSAVGRVESLLISATLALLVMLLEGSAWRGLDNLFIPVGGYFLLHAYLVMDVPMLAARLVVTLALVAAVVLVRQRMTLEDESLVAGAFFCYVAWAVMGWRWLVAPLAIAIGYRWLSPETPDSRRRIHGVPAILSICAAAAAWLALARRWHEPSLLLPYSVVFATHLAMFGTSRLAFHYRDQPLRTLVWRAVALSWAMVMVPMALVTRTGPQVLVAVAAAFASIAIGAVLFVRTQPAIRDLPATPRRWVCQAGAASVASALAWGATLLAGRALP